MRHSQRKGESPFNCSRPASVSENGAVVAANFDIYSCTKGKEAGTAMSTFRAATFLVLTAISAHEIASAQSPVTNLDSIPVGTYYRSGEGWKAMMKSASPSVTFKCLPEWFVRNYGGPRLSDVSATYTGARSPVQLGEPRPVFGIRLEEARDVMLIRVISNKKKNRREAIIWHWSPAGGPHDNPGLVDATLSPIRDHLAFTLTPNYDLKPGEYVITFPVPYKAEKESGDPKAPRVSTAGKADFLQLASGLATSYDFGIK